MRAKIVGEGLKRDRVILIGWEFPGIARKYKDKGK
jgi:hypothetical protein